MRHYASSLIIVDLQSHSLGGHFNVWLNRTVREALRHFDRLTVYVADEMSVPDLTSYDSKDQKRVCVVVIPKIYGKKQYVGDILGVISRDHDRRNADVQAAPLFLMWAQQYLERDLIFPPLKSFLPWKKQLPFDRPWGSLTSVSSVAHGAENIPDMEQRIHDEVVREPSCEAIFLWDEFAIEKLGAKYLYLPNVAHTEADSDWKMNQEGPLTIGSVGELWGYRSINLLADLLAEEADTVGYAAGAQKLSSYSSAALQLVNQKSNSFTLEEGFIKDPVILNSKIRNLDAFVLDARSYKCPSELGIRAMAMGRPLVTVDSPSWVASLIREEGVGVFWCKGEGDLTQKLRSWYLSGGSVRSVKAAQRLSNQQGLEKSYREMFSRLKKRVGQEGR